MNLKESGSRVIFDPSPELGRGFALEGLIDQGDILKLPAKLWTKSRLLGRLSSYVPFLTWILEDESRPAEVKPIHHPVAVHWGYWQSHDYFHSVSDVVYSRLSSWLRYDEWPKKSHCAVHVRRGDYVSDAGAAATLGAQPKDYYERAMRHMSILGFKQFVIYSDDREWVSENLTRRNVTLAPEGSAMDDFLGMASSSALIMSNSSFSWWAAYLASRREIPVVGPASWFSDEDHDATRLMMDGWARI
ncbi:alpha-1,2-fucosyltransferase [Pseudarthrobacter enclensis]|uniref:Alpha-1,2-fucosyltransferase n=1 Tax=Pseudarthrobacter enclensis TaxID=993070 RepID=A0ABT9RX55_9MICC|nr:alpha-1,2-fucosyltransferase [Pseudarthrobacter enclensis]MDP9889818.1 hypothetical protein [Pseudarthrobacter enclensis]